MKKIIIEIDTINAAFGLAEEVTWMELARIFARLSLSMGAPDSLMPTKILDSNGNTVGRIRVKE